MKLTSQQRKATHKYFEEVARELNNQGIDVKVLVENLRVDATPEMMKNIYRAIGKEKFGKIVGKFNQLVKSIPKKFL
jgi:RNA-splicing ligase RtcB